MTFIIGGYASGKHEFARCAIKCSEANIFTVTDVIVDDFQKNNDAIFNIIANHEIVIATEIGCGIVPIDEKTRAHREAAGRLNIRLAQKAEAFLVPFPTRFNTRKHNKALHRRNR